MGTDLGSAEVEVGSNAGTVSLSFDAPPAHVEAWTNAGSVELTVPDEPYAVSASSGNRDDARVHVDVVNDPTAERSLVAHSNAAEVRVRRR